MKRVLIFLFALTMNSSVQSYSEDALPSPTSEMNAIEIDAYYKKKELDKKLSIDPKSARDYCSRTLDIRIFSSRGGRAIIKPGSTVFFEINQDAAENREDLTFQRSGGWIWSCGGLKEQSRIRESSIIKAERASNGTTEWYRVEIKN